MDPQPPETTPQSDESLKGHFGGSLGGMEDAVALRARVQQLESEAERNRRYHEDLTILLEIGSRLTLAASPDELCREAVELGRSRLRFGRLGIWFLNEDGLTARGCFGTDEQGRTRDERERCISLRPEIREGLRFKPLPETGLLEDTDLCNDLDEKVGRGTCLWAPLSDGRRTVGVIFADNLLGGRPFAAYQPTILARYAVLVSHLYGAKRAEAQVRASESLYRTLIDALPEHVWVKDAQSRFVVANQAVVRELGKHGAEELIGRTDADLFPPEEAARYLEEEREVLRTGKAIINREGCAVSPEGVERWGLTTKVPLRDEAGRVTGLVGCVRDITREQQLLRTLEAAENQYRTTCAAMLNPLHVVGRDLRILTFNGALRSFVENSGHPVPEPGQTLQEAFPFLGEQVFDEYRVVFETGQPLVTQETTVCGGREYFTETHKIPLFDGGQVARVVTVMHDLTLHHRLMKTLADSERRVRAIADTVPAGLFVYQDGRVRYVNPMTSRILGYDTEELLGEPDPMGLVHPEDRYAIEAVAARHLAGETDHTQMEYRVVRKDGGVVPVELTARTIEYDGAPAILAAIVDISQRKEAEQQLRLLATAVEQLSEGLAITDLEGRVRFSNPAFARLHGYEVAEVVGKHLSIFHTAEQMPAVERINRAIYRRGEFSGEVGHARKDGSVFPGMMHNVLLRDEVGNAIGLIGTLTDITRLREAERAIEAERNLLRSVIDTVPDPLYVKDTESRFILANQATARDCKVAAPQELIGKTDRDILPAELAAFFREDELRVMQTGRMMGSLERECLEFTADQRQFFITKSPLKDAEGRVIGTVGFNHDVTALKRVEVALRESEERLRLLSDNLPGGLVYQIDCGIDGRERRFTYISGGVQELHEVSAAEVLEDGSRFYKQVCEEHRSLVAEREAAALKCMGVFSVEARVILPSGKTAWRYFASSPRRLSNHHIVWDGVEIDITERKQMEEALRKSETFNRTLVEHLPQHIFLKDRNSIYLSCNNSCARMLGIPAGDVVGKDDYAFYPAEMADKYRADDQAVMHSGEPKELEEPYVVDGEIRWAHTIKVPYRDEQGRVIGVLGVFHDISERRKAEEQLRLTKFSVERASDVIFWIAPDGHIRYANEAACRHLGYSREALLAATVTDIAPNFQTEKWPVHWEELRRRKRMTFETWHKRHSGELVPVEVAVNHLKFAGQEYSFAFARDITERRRAEEALRASEERYRQVLNALPAVIYWVDILEKKTLFLDGAVEQITGYTAEQLVQGSGCFAEILYPGGQPDTRTFIQGKLDALQPFEVEHRIVGAGKRPVRWLSVRIAPMADSTGRPRWAYGVVTDVTQRKESEAHVLRLAQAIESAGEGIGIWGGDGRLKYVNTELTRILGYEPTPERLRGRSWSTLLAGSESRWRQQLVATLERTGKWKGNLLAKRGDGMVIPVAVTLTRLTTKEDRSEVVANLRDRTAEEAYLAQIRKLAADKDQLLEEERTRIARELHDELGQLVTALGLTLQWLGRATPKMRAEVRERVAEAGGIAEQIMRIVRDMSRSLRPPILDHHGFVDAVKSLVADFRRNTGIPCRLILAVPDVPLEIGVVNAAYRILQESLTNVARHAHASQCGVTLKAADRSLLLAVEDDGVGAEAATLKGQESLGVVGMKERAAASGGQIQLERMPEGGVRVTAEFPLTRTSTSEG